MSRWPLRRMLGTVFTVIGAVTVVLVILISSALANLEHARNDRVDRYGPAALATETLSKAYSDQETGLRGFALAGEDSFLVPYTQGRASERAQVRNLRRLLVTRPDLLERLAARDRPRQHGRVGLLPRDDDGWIRGRKAREREDDDGDEERDGDHEQKATEDVCDHSVASALTRL